MLSRNDIGKTYYTVHKNGKMMVLTLTESRWTKEPCFTDGSEYYYITGQSLYEYDDSVCAYWPCDYRPARSILKVIIFLIIAFLLGYCIGRAI